MLQQVQWKAKAGVQVRLRISTEYWTTISRMQLQSWQLTLTASLDALLDQHHV